MKVYLLMCFDDISEYCNNIGVFNSFDKALKVKQELEDDEDCYIHYHIREYEVR